MKNKKSIIVLLLISIYLQLIALPINVSIIGNTDNPGVYIFDSSNRVSQAINYLGTSNIPVLADVENDAEQMEGKLLGLDSEDRLDYSKKLAILDDSDNPLTKIQGSNDNVSYRNVLLIRGGQTIKLNLQDFFLNGDLASNPYLQNDDVIKLLPIESSVELVGQVNKPGAYELIAGEKLSDLIQYGLGFTQDADLANIRINRLNGETGQLKSWTVNYNLIKDNLQHADNIVLEHNDVVKVSTKPYLYEKKVVKVMGLVRYPGEYSIDDNSTLLSVLEHAGGPLPSADLNFAMLIDKSTYGSFDPDLERLLSLNITTMTVTEYSYYQTKLREISGKHYIDIKKLWETKDKSIDRPVKDGDILFIREPQMLVNVSGAVRNAGLQPWDASKNWQDYIVNAGGYTNSAYESKIRIIRYNTKAWVKITRETSVNPGDEIFIPEKPDRTFWEYFTEGLTITAQLITIILGINTLAK